MNNIEKDLINARAHSFCVKTDNINKLDVCDINNVRYVSYGKCISGITLKCYRYILKENDLINVYSTNLRKVVRLIRLDALLQPTLKYIVEVRTPPASGGFRTFETGRDAINALEEISKIKLNEKYCFNVGKSVLDFASGVGADYNKADKDVRGKEASNENSPIVEDRQPSLMDLVMQIESMGWIVTLTRNTN